MTEDVVAYLYKIVNTVNDKVYIGVTKYPSTRFKQHLHRNSNCTHLKHAITKYGKDKFSMIILCKAEESYIVELEARAIEVYDSIENGYNIFPAHHSGKLSIPNEVRLKMIAGIREHYKHNPSRSLGKKWESHPNDVPCYVLGFWFPNKRTARKTLNLGDKTYYKCLGKEAGEPIYKVRIDNVKYSPCYVGGFWFPNRVIAAEALKVSLSAIYARIDRGNVEATNGRTKENYTKSCSGKGKFGSLSPRSKPIIVDGIEYAGIAEAARLTKYTISILQKGLKKGDIRFKYKIG